MVNKFLKRHYKEL